MASTLHLNGLFLFIVFPLAFVVLVLLFAFLQPLTPFDLAFVLLIPLVLPPFLAKAQTVVGLLVGDFVGALLAVGL